MKKLKTILSWTNNSLALAFLILYGGSWISWRSFTEQEAVTIENSDALKKPLEELWASTEQLHLSGVVLVEQGDNVIFARATKSLNANSQLFVGSLTKQWTAAKIQELIQQGKLKLKDTLCSHLNDFCDGDKKSITIQHLLSHKSGLPKSSYSLVETPRALYDIFAHRSLESLTDGNDYDLVSKPGTTFVYSNLGFDVLSRLIQTKTGKSYHDCMKLFFESQGLKNTFIKSPSSTAITSQWNIRPLGTLRLSSTSISSNRFSFENAYGAGAGVSSANDLSLWLQTLLKSGKANELLKIAQSKDNPFTTDKEEQSYINGWVVDSEKNIVWHNGSIPGYRSFALMHPPSGTTAVFIFNSLRLSLDEEKLLRAWEKIFSGQKYSFPKQSP